VGLAPETTQRLQLKICATARGGRTAFSFNLFMTLSMSSEQPQRISRPDLRKPKTLLPGLA